MQVFSVPATIRWSDLDPNFHVRHSVYYDWGAYCRIAFLTEQGLTPALMQQQHFGPIIFREECVFKKEIHFGDAVTIKLFLQKHSTDYRKWTMLHEICTNDTTLAASLTIDGAWMNTALRKITVPPTAFLQAFDAIPKTGDFSISG